VSADDLPPLPTIAPGLYRHYKGNTYRLIGMARHSETLEPLVVYQPQCEGASMWVRPAGMWSELIEHEGQRIERFTKIAE
jgi:hypothetical protein